VLSQCRHAAVGPAGRYAEAVMSGCVDPRPNAIAPPTDRSTAPRLHALSPPPSGKCAECSEVDGCLSTLEIRASDGCRLGHRGGAENLLLIGPVGTHKSHLLGGAGRAAVAAGCRVRYFAATDLVEMMYRGLADNSLAKLIDGLLRRMDWPHRPG
jgi:IstB-like ATP binding protein